MASSGYISLSLTDLALAATLLLVDAALSAALHLGIARTLLIAAVRMTGQLALVGLALTALFATGSAPLTLGAAVAMALFAGLEVMNRQDRPLRGAWRYGLGTGAVLCAGTIVTLLALTTQIRPHPWYDPRYLIPLLGMILGNSMSGIALGLNTLSGTVHRDRSAIEARLALGHSRWQALRRPTRLAIRTALMPTVNNMAVTGLVFLPGMMTGQILAGVDPQQAVRYQLLIMFLLAGATGIGVLIAVLILVVRLTDDRHRLRLDRLAPPRQRD